MDYAMAATVGLYVLFLLPLLWGLVTGLKTAGHRRITQEHEFLGAFTVPATALLINGLLICTRMPGFFEIGMSDLKTIGVFVALLNWVALLLAASLLAGCYHTGLLFGLTIGPKK